MHKTDSVSLVDLRVIREDGQTKLHEQEVHGTRSELGIVLSRCVERTCIRTRVKTGEFAIDTEESGLL